MVRATVERAENRPFHVHLSRLTDSWLGLFNSELGYAASLIGPPPERDNRERVP